MREALTALYCQAESDSKLTSFSIRQNSLREHDPSRGEFILLNRTRYDVPESNITILGCTLW